MSRFIGFYPDWSNYREGLGKYNYENLGPYNIVIYAFASMDPVTFNVIPVDVNAAKDQYAGFMLHCRETGKKPVLALGGWVDSAGNKYSKMMSHADSRQTFINSTINYLFQNGFKGLNLDIEYPTCPQADTKNGNEEDRNRFTDLIKEMKSVFHKNNMELSICVPGAVSMIERAYHLEELNDCLDWIGVMSYDYHTSHGKIAGPISSIKDTRTAVNYLINKGVSRDKIVVGVPFYGHRYCLKFGETCNYGAESEGRGAAGPYTGEAGFLAYYEIIGLQEKFNYNIVEHEDGAFTWKGNDFISYNSMNDIDNKVKLVNDLDLSGLMIWDSSMDDFTGQVCHQGKNPLSTFIRDRLKSTPNL